mgnify:CR=1 FL=1
MGILRIVLCISLLVLGACTDRSKDVIGEVDLGLPYAIKLVWDIPVQREDGSYLAMHEISAYTIQYGTDKDNLDVTVSVPEAGTTSLLIEGLVTYPMYFKINTVDSDGLHGRYSDVIIIADED